MNQNNSLEMLKQQFANNPLFNRAIEMAKDKDESDLEQIARNLCKEKGINLEDAWNAFQKQFKF